MQPLDRYSRGMTPNLCRWSSYEPTTAGAPVVSRRGRETTRAGVTAIWVRSLNGYFRYAKRLTDSRVSKRMPGHGAFEPSADLPDFCFDRFPGRKRGSEFAAARVPDRGVGWPGLG